jgi:hypothetical protein
MRLTILSVYFVESSDSRDFILSQLCRSVKKQTRDVSIKIKRETHRRLQQRGTAGDTLDSVIARLLDVTEETK